MGIDVGHHWYCRLLSLVNLSSRFSVGLYQLCNRYGFGLAMEWDTFTRETFSVMAA